MRMWPRFSCKWLVRTLTGASLSLAAGCTPYFRPTTDPSGTAQIAFGESPTKPADVGPNPDQRESTRRSGSPETPGDPANVAPSFVNRRFARSELAERVGFEPTVPVTAHTLSKRAP